MLLVVTVMTVISLRYNAEGVKLLNMLFSFYLGKLHEIVHLREFSGYKKLFELNCENHCVL